MKLSPLSLGTWTFAGDSIWSDTPESQAVEVLRHGADRGIVLFDTAPNYGEGRSEKILGKALGNRDGIVVASKCKIDGLDRSSLVRIVESSLTALRRDAIDLMQIHWPSLTPGETSAALDIFMDLRREGKIREIGVCNFGVADLSENEDVPIAANQLPYSLMWRVIERNIAGYTKSRGIPVIAYSPLQQGLLSGVYSSLDQFPAGRKRTRHYLSELLVKETQNCLEGFLKISAESDIPPMELAIGYILSRGFIDSVLAGARTVSQLDELLSGAERTIPPDVLDALDICSFPLYMACGGNPDMYASRVRY